MRHGRTADERGDERTGTRGQVAKHGGTGGGRNGGAAVGRRGAPSLHEEIVWGQGLSAGTLTYRRGGGVKGPTREKLMSRAGWEPSRGGVVPWRWDRESCDRCRCSGPLPVRGGADPGALDARGASRAGCGTAFGRAARVPSPCGSGLPAATQRCPLLEPRSPTTDVRRLGRETEQELRPLSLRTTVAGQHLTQIWWLAPFSPDLVAGTFFPGTFFPITFLASCQAHPAALRQPSSSCPEVSWRTSGRTSHQAEDKSPRGRRRRGKKKRHCKRGRYPHPP